MQRACLTCGTPFTPTLHKQTRCHTHQPRGRKNRSPTTQAQNAEYQHERKRTLTPNATCHWCGQPATTADHLTPISHGATHKHNLVPACAPCNYARQDNPNWKPPPPNGQDA